MISPTCRRPPALSPASLQDVPGAADVKIEQTTGLPVLHVRVDRAAIARYGLTCRGRAGGGRHRHRGREAGLVFEGDRRFPLVVRLPESYRARISTRLKTLPIPLPHQENEPPAARSGGAQPGSRPNGPSFHPAGELARLDVSEGPNQISRENGKRRVVVQANVRGRDLGSFVDEAQAAHRRTRSAFPPGAGSTGAGSSKTSSRPVSA